jgi:hypothetical protein
MSVESICRRVTQFGFTLLETEFALDARQHKVDRLSSTRKALSWVRDDGAGLMTGNPSRVSDYLAVLERLDYSYLMRDGGNVQVAYVYDNNEIERHRLAYYPCPFQISSVELERQGSALVDYINDAFMGDVEENVLLRSPFRFDYAPDASGDFHPASHLTINGPTCRIPARAPLKFATFMKFILENF